MNNSIDTDHGNTSTDMQHTLECLEQSLQRRIAMEKHVNDAAIRLINASPNEFEDAVAHILQILGEFAHADRSYIFLFLDDYRIMTNTHEWCAEGTEPQIMYLQNLSTEDTQWWLGKLRKGENIYIRDVSEMPPEAQTEQKTLEMQDIHSLIVVPMYAQKRLTGYIGFDAVSRELEWPEVDVYMLRTVGDILASVMARNNYEVKLKFEREQLLSIFDSLDDAIYISDSDTYEILYANKCLKKQIGSNPIGKTCYRILQNRESPCDFCNNNTLRENKGKSIRWQHYNPLFNKYFQIIDRMISWPDGREVRFEIAFDITQLKETENNLSAANNIINNSQAVVFLWKNENEWPVEYVSGNVEYIFGYTKEEFLSGEVRYAEIIHPDDMNRIIEDLDTYSSDKKCTQFNHEPYRIITKSGDIKWIDDRSAIRRDKKGRVTHYHGIILDITQRMLIEEQLRQYSDTQRVLLKEVNHRVKNNLSAIISILHKEEDRAIEEQMDTYIPVLSDLVGRVQGLLTVHTLLSASEWKPLDMGVLCDEVMKGAIQGLPRDRHINFTIEADPVLIDSQYAHNMTLLINELATNSIKHALNGRKTANIAISIHRENEYIVLVYRDDGPGYPEDLLNGDYSTASIGFSLVQGIAEQSLDGEVIFSNDSGAVTTIRFEYCDTDNDVDHITEL